MNFGSNASILLMKEGFNRFDHKHEIKTFMINKKWFRVSLKFSSEHQNQGASNLPHHQSRLLFVRHCKKCLDAKKNLYENAHPDSLALGLK